MHIKVPLCEVTQHAVTVPVMIPIHVTILQQSAVNQKCQLHNLKYRFNA
jgi:hypothetical protein